MKINFSILPNIEVSPPNLGRKPLKLNPGLADTKYLRLLQIWHYKTTVWPISSDPFYIVPYNIKWVTTSWTHSMYKTIFSALNSYKLLYNGQKYCPSSYCDFYTICPRSSDPFYIVSYYTKLVTTSWTHSMKSDKTCWAKYLKIIYYQRKHV